MKRMYFILLLSITTSCTSKKIVSDDPVILQVRENYIKGKVLSLEESREFSRSLTNSGFSKSFASEIAKRFSKADPFAVQVDKLAQGGDPHSLRDLLIDRLGAAKERLKMCESMYRRLEGYIVENHFYLSGWEVLTGASVKVPTPANLVTVSVGGLGIAFTRYKGNLYVNKRFSCRECVDRLSQRKNRLEFLNSETSGNIDSLPKELKEEFRALSADTNLYIDCD